MSFAAIKTIHTGFRQMGITEEDDKRAFYMRVVGQTSLKAMSDQQRQRVIEEQRRQGFKPASKGGRKALEGKFAGKLQALWIAGYNLGVVTNGSNEALIAFVHRQTGLDHVRFLHHLEDADKAIDGLKQWLSRVAGVDWRDNQAMPSWARTPGYKIATAQWRILRPETGHSLLGFGSAVHELTGRNSMEEMTSKDWITVMNAFGMRVRRTAR